MMKVRSLQQRSVSEAGVRSADSVCEGVNEFVYVRVRVIERNRRNAENVRLAPVADHAFAGETIAERASIIRYMQRQLSTAALRIARCDDGEFVGCVLIKQRFEITS